MNNNSNKTLSRKHIENQPDKHAIREVYFGHIGNINYDDSVTGDADYIEDLRKSKELKAKLLPLLNEEQLKELDKLIELIEITNIESEVSYYESGFKLGVNLGMECLPSLLSNKH